MFRAFEYGFTPILEGIGCCFYWYCRSDELALPNHVAARFGPVEPVPFDSREYPKQQILDPWHVHQREHAHRLAIVPNNAGSSRLHVSPDNSKLSTMGIVEKLIYFPNTPKYLEFQKPGVGHAIEGITKHFYRFQPFDAVKDEFQQLLQPFKIPEGAETPQELGIMPDRKRSVLNVLQATGTQRKYRDILKTSDQVFEFFLRDRLYRDQQQSIAVIKAELDAVSTDIERDPLELSLTAAQEALLVQEDKLLEALNGILQGYRKRGHYNDTESKLQQHWTQWSRTYKLLVLTSIRELESYKLLVEVALEKEAMAAYLPSGDDEAELVPHLIWSRQHEPRNLAKMQDQKFNNLTKDAHLVKDSFGFLGLNLGILDFQSIPTNRSQFLLDYLRRESGLGGRRATLTLGINTEYLHAYTEQQKLEWKQALQSEATRPEWIAQNEKQTVHILSNCVLMIKHREAENFTVSELPLDIHSGEIGWFRLIRVTSPGGYELAKKTSWTIAVFNFSDSWSERFIKLRKLFQRWGTEGSRIDFMVHRDQGLSVWKRYLSLCWEQSVDLFFGDAKVFAYVGERGFAFPPSTYDSTERVINKARDEYSQLPPDLEAELSENIEDSILYQTTYASLEDCNQAGMTNGRPGVSLLTMSNFQMYFNRLHHRDLFSWYFFGNPAESQDDDKPPGSFEEWSHSENFHFIKESRERDTMVCLIVHNCSAQGAGHCRDEMSCRLADVSSNARELEQKGKIITAKTLRSTGRRMLSISSPQVSGHCEPLSFRSKDSHKFIEALMDFKGSDDLEDRSIQLLDFEVDHKRPDLNYGIQGAHFDDQTLRRHGHYEPRSLVSRPFFVTLAAASRGNANAPTSKEAKKRMAEVNEHLEETHDWAKYKGTATQRSQSAGKSSSSSKSVEKKQQQRSDDRSRSRGTYAPQRTLPYANESERSWHFASSDPRYKHWFCCRCTRCYILPASDVLYRRCKICASMVTTSPDPNLCKGMILADFKKEWVVNDTWIRDQKTDVSASQQENPQSYYKQRAQLTQNSSNTDDADRPPGDWHGSSDNWSWQTQRSDGYGQQQPSSSANEPAYVQPCRNTWSYHKSWIGYDQCYFCEEVNPRHQGQDCPEAPWNKRRREQAAASAAASQTDYSTNRPGQSWNLLKKEMSKAEVDKAWEAATQEVVKTDPVPTAKLTPVKTDAEPKAKLTPRKEEKQDDDPWANAPSDAKCQTEEDPLETALRGASSHLDDETMQKMRALVAEAQEKKRRTTQAPYVPPQPKIAPPPRAPQRAPLAPVKIPTPPKPTPPARPVTLSKAITPRPPAHAPPSEIVADVIPEVPVHVPPPPVSYPVQPPMPQAALPPPGMRPAMPYQEFSRPAYVPQHYDAFAPGYNPYAQMPPRPSTVPMTFTVDVPMEHIPPYFQGMPYPTSSPPRSYGPYYNYR